MNPPCRVTFVVWYFQNVKRHIIINQSKQEKSGRGRTTGTILQYTKSDWVFSGNCSSVLTKIKESKREKDKAIELTKFISARNAVSVMTYGSVAHNRECGMAQTHNRTSYLCVAVIIKHCTQTLQPYWNKLFIDELNLIPRNRKDIFYPLSRFGIYGMIIYILGILSRLVFPTEYLDQSIIKLLYSHASNNKIITKFLTF